MPRWSESDLALHEERVSGKLDLRIRERDFQSKVVALFREHGWAVQYTPRTAKTTPAGWPDLVCVRANAMVVAELKVVGKKPTLAQEKWLAALAAVPGCTVYRWTPSAWSEIQRVAAGLAAETGPRGSESDSMVEGHRGSSTATGRR